METSNIFEKRCDLIGQIDFFEGCSKTFLCEIASLMKEQTFEKNTQIVQQGDVSQNFYLIVSGRTKVFVNNEQGTQTVFSFLGCGEYFGELSLFDNDPRSAAVLAIKQTTVLSLSQENFFLILNHYPEFCWTMFRAMTTRIRELDEVICSLTSKNTYDKLIYRLHREAKLQADGSLIMPKITHQDLADMIGSSREMVSRIFTELKHDGVIKIKNKKITLLEPQVLIKHAV